MTEAEIRQIVQQEIQQAASSNRFHLTGIPRHIHNGQDSPQIPGTSVTAFQIVPSGPGSVLGLDTLNTQNYSYLGQLNVAPVLSVPLVIIEGYGVGDHSAFNGGDAPEGTMVLFTNGDTLSTLNIRSDNASSGWFSATLSGS